MTLLLDEFVSYGRLGFFVHHLAVLGGRGIRTLVAVQNLPQLTQTYGHSDLITEQCKVRLFFAANGQTDGPRDFTADRDRDGDHHSGIDAGRRLELGHGR